MANICWLIPFLAAACLIPVASVFLRRYCMGVNALFEEDSKALEKAVSGLKGRQDALAAELRRFDEDCLGIAGLYEITKAMSATLFFDEIFRIFSDFLKGNFRFSACKLILAGQEGPVKTVEKVYKLDFEGPDVRRDTRQVGRGDAVDAEILSEVSRSKRVIFWEDFVAIPLITQNEVIGILNVEGLEESALERFLIVSRQFSLEIEKVRLYETLQELAVTDGLTGILVRRYFFEMLKVEFERSQRHNFKMSFLMADLDYFKQCNDRFGHLIGDAVLREVAGVLKQNLREIDLLCRYGGEEFAALLPETDKAGAFLVAERLRNAVAGKEFKAYEEVLRTTISIGVSTFPDNAKSIAELIELADKALYEAKARGRNRSAGA